MSHYRFSADGLGVELVEDGAIVACIPCDPANTDYARLLAEGVAIAPHRPAPTLDEARAAKLQELAAFRYEREVSGYIHDGFPVRTDRESQSALGNAIQLAKEAAARGLPAATVWKGVNAFRAFDLESLITLGLAVGGYINGFFARESALAAEIAALPDIAAIEAFDIAQRWADL